MIQAMEAVISGEMETNQAAREFDVPGTTLREIIWKSETQQQASSHSGKRRASISRLLGSSGSSGIWEDKAGGN